MEGINNVEESGQPMITDHGGFEILKQSPMLGDGKFKLEIGMKSLSSYISIVWAVLMNHAAPTLATDSAPSSNTTTLSLYITSLMADFTQDDHEAYASMMAAIKCQDDLSGERGARPEWVWEFWQNDWVFRRDSEVWGQCLFEPLRRIS